MCGSATAATDHPSVQSHRADAPFHRSDFPVFRDDCGLSPKVHDCSFVLYQNDGYRFLHTEAGLPAVPAVLLPSVSGFLR